MLSEAGVLNQEAGKQALARQISTRNRGGTYPDGPEVGGRYRGYIGDVVEEANPTKSRWREWPLSSSAWGKCSVVGRKGCGPDLKRSLAGGGPLVRRKRAR